MMGIEWAPQFSRGQMFSLSSTRYCCMLCASCFGMKSSTVGDKGTKRMLSGVRGSEAVCVAMFVRFFEIGIS